MVARHRSSNKQRIADVLLEAETNVCAVRVVAFSIRAYMQNHLTQNLAITYEVWSCGCPFASALYE